MSDRAAPGGNAGAADATIVEGYRPGAIGRIATLHAEYYSRYWRLGLFFEAKVARDCAAFVSRMGVRDRLWLIVRDPVGDGEIVGSLAIDGSEDDSGRVAHLRWFIMADGARGCGLGGTLMSRAVTFCREAGFDSVYLWTFAGLDAARHLYEKHGFSLVEALDNAQWGMSLPEQRLELRLAPAAD